MHEVSVRPATAADAAAAGTICHAALLRIAQEHGFPPNFASAEAASGLTGRLLDHPRVYGVVAERDGRVVGSNFLDERDQVAGVGPVTVDPDMHDADIGVRLMEDVLARAETRGFQSVRLCQPAYHTHSMALYTRLGFQLREALSAVQGPALLEELPWCAVRAAGSDDLEACGALAERLLGAPRTVELADAVAAGSAMLVERGGRVTGYTTGVAFYGHTVGRANEDVAALIGAAPAFDGPGFLIPTRNADLLRWCLVRGLQIVQPMNLMSRGPYAEPRGVWLPSVLG